MGLSGGGPVGGHGVQGVQQLGFFQVAQALHGQHAPAAQAADGGGQGLGHTTGLGSGRPGLNLVADESVVFQALHLEGFVVGGHLFGILKHHAQPLPEKHLHRVAQKLRQPLERERGRRIGHEGGQIGLGGGREDNTGERLANVG